MRVETLYKTSTPEKETSECVEIVIDILPWIGPRNFRFLRRQGRWDEHSGRYALVLTDPDAVEKGVTLEEAEAMYVAAKAECVNDGFVHSFAPDYSRDGTFIYELLKSS